MPDIALRLFDWVSRLPVVGFRAARELERLDALHEEALLLLENPRAQPMEAVPTVSGWSPVQHFYHAAAIGQEVLGQVRAQCAGDAAPNPRGGPNRAGCFILLAGRIPRGRAQTPGAYEPPTEPKRAAVRALLEENQEAVHELQRHLPRLERLPGRTKHPRMGRLDPREWLRFLRIHTRHHQRIVREIVEAQ